MGAMPVADRVQEAFQTQIAALAEPARIALLIAAADGSGELETVVGAGASLHGLESAEREPAARDQRDDRRFPPSPGSGRLPIKCAGHPASCRTSSPC